MWSEPREWRERRRRGDKRDQDSSVAMHGGNGADVAGMMTGAIVGGKSVEQAARLQSTSLSLLRCHQLCHACTCLEIVVSLCTSPWDATTVGVTRSRGQQADIYSDHHVQ